MIKLQNINKTYTASSGKKVKAADNISIDFDNSGLVFIVGKSGSGKSTLLNIVGGLDIPDSGEIIVDGISSSQFVAKDYDDYRNKFLGFVFQEYNLIEHKTVSENIEIALLLQRLKKDKSEIEELLKALELVDDDGCLLTDRKITELSVGQKQRVSIARALIKKPKIILADEPTGALDEQTGERFLELCKELSRDRLIIIVTHNSEYAKKYGDRIVEIDSGKIVSDTKNTVLECNTKISAENPIALKSSNTPKLSFKSKLLMALEIFKFKRFRLITSMVLSIICFILFGYMLMAVSANHTRAEIRMLYRHDINIVSLTQLHTVFNQRQLDIIHEFSPVVIPVRNATFFDSGFDSFNDYLKEDNQLEFTRNEWLAELDPQTGLTDAGLRVDYRFINPQNSRLPQSFNEIAITDFRADFFIRYGYISYSGELIEIATPDDLIGLTLGWFTIVGVFSTQINYRPLFDVANANRALYINSARNTVLTFSFVLNGFFDNITGQINPSFIAALIQLSGNISGDIRFLNSLEFFEEREDGIRQGYRAYFNSIYSGVAGRADNFIWNMWLPSLILGGIFIVLSVLMTLNFLTVSLSFKKRYFGILRALGAGKKDIFSIFILESALITVVNFIVALIGIYIAAAIINAVFLLPIFIFGPLQVLFFILLSFGTAFLACIFPVRKFLKMSAVDMIKAT